MCCRQVAIAKMVQFLGARRASLRDAVWGGRWIVWALELTTKAFLAFRRFAKISQSQRRLLVGAFSVITNLWMDLFQAGHSG